MNDLPLIVLRFLISLSGLARFRICVDVSVELENREIDGRNTNRSHDCGPNLKERSGSCAHSCVEIRLRALEVVVEVVAELVD